MEGEAYLRVGACFALLVLLMAGPLVQLGPECLRLPVVELGLELVVEDAAVGGLQLQVVAQLLEGLQRALARARLDEVVEQRVRAVHLDCPRHRSAHAHAHIPHGPDSRSRAVRAVQNPLAGVRGSSTSPDTASLTTGEGRLTASLKQLPPGREREER